MNKTNVQIWRGRVTIAVIFAIVATVVLFSSIYKYKSGEIDYFNSDATWHTMLTIEAYNETPISHHLFLPIVSLGEPDDKGISWGATVPDSEGNYYYTSFSPMGYFLPWMFIKIFHLSVSEKSLYIFNTLLFFLSTGLLMWLLLLVYRDNKHKKYLCLIGGIVYALLPELLHGMGIVYWHQSILQVTLLLQIIAYYQYAVLNDRRYKWLFYILAFLNPYTEWTGYVANVGFAIAELIINWKNDWKRGFKKAFILGVITIVAFGLFSLHFLLRIDVASYLFTLKERFMARNVTTGVPITEVIAGYLNSFLYGWLLLLLLITWCFVKKRRLEINEGILCLVMVFPVLENIIMKAHAVSYSYDRMKAAWILIFIICESARNILENSKKKRVPVILLIMVCLLSMLNLKSYKNNEHYICAVDYKENNKTLANYMNKHYPDAIYASNSSIRGYMNLLFGRGIYEAIDINRAAELALQKGKNTIVYIQPSGYSLQTVMVYDSELLSGTEYYVENGKVISDITRTGYHLANLTDENWVNGYSESTRTLLFGRDNTLLIDLYSHQKIVVNGEKIFIKTIEYDDMWIRVEVNRDAFICEYPQKISLE